MIRIIERVVEREQTPRLCSRGVFPAPKHLRGTYASIAPEVGHIIPHGQGGDYVPENLQCEHRGCNLEKNFTGDPSGTPAEGGAVGPQEDPWEAPNWIGGGN